MGFTGRIRCALCCSECESLRELIWADILWHSTLIFANIFFICLTTFLTHSLSLFLSLCLSFSQLDKGQGLQWSNINEDGFVVYVDRWEKFKRIKNSICQQVDEGKWATGWLVFLATWGDTLSARRRVGSDVEGGNFLLLIVPPSGVVYMIKITIINFQLA